MLFDTPIYFLFLTLVVCIYWRLARRSQNLFLLVSSYVFYGWWDWRFLFLMGTSTLVDYALGLKIGQEQRPSRRKMLLIISLAMNFGFLGFFKYCNFFIDSFAHVAALFGYTGATGPYLSIILPAGISFYTFQAVAYICDVYFRKLEPAPDLVDYALFISLFPHLVAGPIQRPAHLLPQVQHSRQFDAANFYDGLLLILTGLFRKCVVADNCALVANAAFNGQLGPPSLPVLALGAYAFAWQIYGDFSGYSDIARGSAQLMGFHFMINFRQPYLATGLSDFWRRWHMSLSSWLRDYLYIPLGGNRKGEFRTYGNLLTTMLLGGLWHGANWTFVLWGGLQGAGLAVQRGFGLQDSKEDEARNAASPRPVAKTWLWRVVVFHFICLAWVFFRAPSMTGALKMLAGATVFSWTPLYLFHTAVSSGLKDGSQE
jgi:alginate O-acetyltransferase complex protein AlgI